MPAKPLVIFDCDGVLVDSEPISNRIFHDMLSNDLGLELTLEEVMATFVGRTMNSCKDILQEKYNTTIDETFLATFGQRCTDIFQQELQPVENILDCINYLLRHGYSFCVASSGSHQKMQTTLGVTKLLSFFEGAIFSATDVANSKPAPDIFLHAAKCMNRNPVECIVVEDSPLGVQAAHAAGMKVIAYAERTPALRLEAESPSALITSMKNLCTTLERMQTERSQ